MRFFGSAFMVATFLFAGPTSIVALPTANNAAVVSSLQSALEILGDNSMLGRRGFFGTSFARAGHGLQVPLCKLSNDNRKVPLGEGIVYISDIVTGGRH